MVTVSTDWMLRSFGRSARARADQNSKRSVRDYFLCFAGLAAVASVLQLGCGSDSSSPSTAIKEEACRITDTSQAPDFIQYIGCQQDFETLASEPIDATIPGARSAKVVLDTADSNALYFQNSKRFKIHHQFAINSLSVKGPQGQGLPLVPGLSDFNTVEYSNRAQRRFILGAVTYYEAPKVWALELAPYDQASAAQIQLLYESVKKASWFGPALVFHPTSEALAAVAKTISGKLKIESTDELFAKIDYQPLNLGTTEGKLRFMTADQLETEYVGFQDIVVLDRVPNDISVVAGLITEQFQTPLSHVNVLAQNRGTPNMGLRKASTNAKLLAVKDKWVKFTVGASDWDIKEVTQAEVDQYWSEHGPTPLTLPTLNTSVRDLRDVELLVDEKSEGTLKMQIQAAIQAFGTKASNYGVLKNTAKVPVRKGFAIPFYYYVQFMTENGFFTRVDQLLADASFKADAEVRDQKLAELRANIEAGKVSQEFSDLLKTKLDTDYPGQTMRFRTSTNAEDLDGFPCAGCYESHTGDPKDWEGSLLRAIKRAWAGVWFFRTFEEREYHHIDHKSVAMALLVHHNFPAEEANGVASTANPYDPSGLEQGFYINVQWGGDAEVVHPPPSVTSDEFLLFWGQSTQTTSYLGHSNLPIVVDSGKPVLDESQIIELGTALDAIHSRFSPAYGPASGNTGWYAMDVEFKFDDEGQADGKPHLLVKQARPYPGRGN